MFEKELKEKIVPRVSITRICIVYYPYEHAKIEYHPSTPRPSNVSSKQTTTIPAYPPILPSRTRPHGPPHRPACEPRLILRFRPFLLACSRHGNVECCSHDCHRACSMTRSSLRAALNFRIVQYRTVTCRIVPRIAAASEPS